jgi:hypothetical protein
MLVRLSKNLPDAQLKVVLALARELGYEAKPLGAQRELLELTGRGAPDHRSRFEDLAASRA